MSLPHAIDTKSPAKVAEVADVLFARLGFRQSAYLVDRLFQDVTRMFAGKYPGYQAIDMVYHDLEHTLQTTVCLCQILEGRQAARARPLLGRRDCELMLAAMLLHDTGYLKRTGDRQGTGAKYTLVHVRRSGEFARDYLPSLGFSTDEITDVTTAISCTGPTNKLPAVFFRRPEARVIAMIVVTADYLGQMAAAEYVDELPILFREFEEAYDFEGVPAAARAFQSAPDLIRKTPAFWDKFVRPMLDDDLERVYRFIAPSADGTNPYFTAVEHNIARVRAVATAPDISLDPFPAPDRRATLA